MDAEPEKVLADTGDLDVDLTELLIATGEAVRERNTAIAVFIDEMGQTGRAKSYAERLFNFPEIGPLDDGATRLALPAPAGKEGVQFTDEALEEILLQAKGYPYFIQEWGKHAWSVAATTPITLSEIKLATDQATADLDASFFRVRFDRLTPAEKISSSHGKSRPRPSSVRRHRGSAK